MPRLKAYRESMIPQRKLPLGKGIIYLPGDVSTLLNYWSKVYSKPHLSGWKF